MATYVFPSAIVVEVLRNDNYENWRCCIKSYLSAQGLWHIVEPTTSCTGTSNDKRPEVDSSKDLDNQAALHAIQISCSPDVLSKIRTIDSAKEAWDALANMQRLQVQTAPEPPPLPPVANTVDQNKQSTRYLELINHAYRGNWDAVKSFIDHHPESRNAKITSTGGTVLHVAIYSGDVKFVEKLVELMLPEDLEIRDNILRTALYPVATGGNTMMAKCMIKKNANLLNLTSNDGLIPVVVSCRGNNKDLTSYFYSETKSDVLFQNNGSQGSLLLQYCIICKMFDIALDLLHRHPSLALVIDNILNYNPLFRLADMPEGFPSGSRLAFWQKWIYSCIHVRPLTSCKVDHGLDRSQCESMVIMKKDPGRLHNLVVNLLKFLGIKQIYDMKLTHIYSIELLRLMCEHISTVETMDKYSELGIFDAFNQAVMNGIVEFIMNITEVCPKMVDFGDGYGRNLFMASVAHRQEKVFSLFYGLEGLNRSYSSLLDKDKNTMLHWAGALSPPARLAQISGAALQMQRELQWYQEIESIVNPMILTVKNQHGKTPGQLFADTHKDLMEKGEKWIKETASSSTVVGALIITVMFTALFTSPGGNKETGFPVFLHHKAFVTFIISDALSLFASSTSVMMFLGILTSRYSQKDFLKSLPRKLIIGLSMLFFSIATMMVAFCAALFIVMDGRLEVVIPICLLAGIPVTLFILLQFPLLVEIFISTYGPGIFNKKMKRCY